MTLVGEYEHSNGPVELYDYWKDTQRHPSKKRVTPEPGDIICGQLFVGLHESDSEPPPKNVLAMVVNRLGEGQRARFMLIKLVGIEDVGSGYPVVLVANPKNPKVEKLDLSRASHSPGSTSSASSSSTSSTSGDGTGLAPAPRFVVPDGGLWATVLVDTMPARCVEVGSGIEICASISRTLSRLVTLNMFRTNFPDPSDPDARGQAPDNGDGHENASSPPAADA